jgi:hypothetical protein
MRSGSIIALSPLDRAPEDKVSRPPDLQTSRQTSTVLRVVIRCDDRVAPTTDGEHEMALFMDTHTLEGGVSAADVAAAHQADLATQGRYGVDYLRYWVDEEAGKIFCLVEAPDAQTASTVHREAHGLVAQEIYGVSEHS